VTVLSDEELWEKVQEDLAWVPPPVDLEKAEHFARFWKNLGFEKRPTFYVKH
jgi:hypothetical protein